MNPARFVKLGALLLASLLTFSLGRALGQEDDGIDADNGVGASISTASFNGIVVLNKTGVKALNLYARVAGGGKKYSQKADMLLGKDYTLTPPDNVERLEFYVRNPATQAASKAFIISSGNVYALTVEDSGFILTQRKQGGRN